MRGKGVFGSMQRFLHVRGCPLGLINISEGRGVRITILEWPSCFRRSVGPFADGYPHLVRLVTRIALTIRFTTFRIVSASVPAAGGVALGNNKDQDGAGGPMRNLRRSPQRCAGVLGPAQRRVGITSSSRKTPWTDTPPVTKDFRR